VFRYAPKVLPVLRLKQAMFSAPVDGDNFFFSEKKPFFVFT
jgi:hypothetical protein